jgi:molybdopterin adenylyltransferase
MSKSIEVISVNISDKKGTIKHPVPEIHLGPNGIDQDAHSGRWHRQVSMLGTESIDRFSVTAARKINYGEFAENISTKGMELIQAKPFDIFVNDNVTLEITQIGKECHGHTCNIFKEVGNCVMPKEGIFCRVKKGGILKAGDQFKYVPKVFKIAVITLSDRAYSGEYEDISGPTIISLVEDYFNSKDREYSFNTHLLPDDAEKLKECFENEVKAGTDIIITTGGTGVGIKDITIETIRPLIDKEIPGIMEMIRIKFGQEKPNALLTRSMAGVKDYSLVYALPGSVKAVKEYMPEIFRTLEHLMYMLHGIDAH